MIYNKIKQQYQETISKLNKKLVGLTREKKAILLLLVLAFISLIAFGVYSVFNWGKNFDNKEKIQNESSLTKATADKEDNIPGDYVRRRIESTYANNYPIAVMIDNDPNARPQSGLAHAQVVYEAKAESGITRFLAIFANGDELGELGPIRSARPYFVDWARGYDALYIHVGGSPEALSILKSIKMLDLNEFYQGNYFWRSNDKYAPHNVYSSIENAKKYLDKLNAENDDYVSWQFKDEKSEEERGEQNIEINFSVNDFLVDWKYDKKNNEYIRYMAGAQHKDADGTEIKAKNIVVMKMDSEVLDEAFRRKMYNIGEGQAWYCFDGVCEIGMWKKPNSDTREKIYDASDEEIRFNAGTTWVEVVQYEGEISITN